jgi:tricorn protease interacting factor F2/3
MLFDHKTASIRAKEPRDVVVNLHRTGYFSVHYDRETYARLARRFPTLNKLDRAGIINDLYLFMQAGAVEPEQYFQFVQAAAKLTDPLVSELITDHLSNLRAIADEAPMVREAYSSFYPSQIRSYGMSPKRGEDESVGKVRETLVPHLVRTNPGYARRLARRFDDFESVEPNLKVAVAIAYAVTKGGAAYDPLVGLVKRAQVEIERSRIYPALTSFEEPALVEKALELSISGEVSRSDSFFTLTGAALNPKMRSTLWNWLSKRYNRISEIYGGSQSFFFILDRIIPQCGVGREAEVRGFLSGKKYKEGETTFRRTFELLDINSRLRKTLLSS